MPANYQLSDLRQILPFTCAEDCAPFMDKADAGGGHVFYLTGERGLWLHIPCDEHDDETFEAITGFGKHELRHMRMDDLLVYGLKDGTPLLPLPFTAAQLVELDERTGRVFSARIECGSDTDDVIAEMAQRSPEAAELARALLYGDMPVDMGAGDVPAHHAEQEGAATRAFCSKPRTAEELAEMKAYRALHGTKATAKQYVISDARVRQLLPGEKPQPKGYSAFTHR